MDDGLIERSRRFTENFAYDINLVRGLMRKMANALEAQQSEIASLRGALEPLARLRVPVKPQGNSGAYSIFHRDIERAAALTVNTGGE